MFYRNRRVEGTNSVRSSMFYRNRRVEGTNSVSSLFIATDMSKERTPSGIPCL
jgi:hypothetical protein